MLVVALLLAACSNTDALDALGPPAEAGARVAGPVLTTSPVVAGDGVTLTARGFAPGALVTFLRGASTTARPSCPSWLAGACTALRQPVVLEVATANANGVATVAVGVPETLSVGAALTFEATTVGARAQRRTEVVEGHLLFGVWNDSYGFAHEIDHQTWRQDFGAWHIARWDVASGAIFARNDASNTYFPNRWSRFDTTVQAGQVWYCQTAYAEPTLADAVATPAADATDLASGCAGFAWSQLVPSAPDIEGVWSDAYGTSHTIDAFVWDQGWTSFAVERYSNLDQVFIAQNAPNAPFFPGLWSRFDWTEVAGDVWYCQTAYDAASAWEARQTPAADATDPANTGCGGFAWTQLTP
jgi:hypothetical protein